jgi:hypothetical protein
VESQALAFNARKYEKGSANPAEVQICVEGGHLIVIAFGDADRKIVPIEDLDVNIAGHDEDRIKLTNVLSGEVIMCHESGLLEQIQNASNHKGLQTQTKTARSKLKTRSTRRFLSWGFATAVVAGFIISVFMSVDTIVLIFISKIKNNPYNFNLYLKNSK